jgi:hypothetical protein
MSNADSYRYMLQDMVFELNELMVEHQSSPSDVRAAIMNFAGIVRRKFVSFEIEEPALSGPISEPDIWVARGAA